MDSSDDPGSPHQAEDQVNALVVRCLEGIDRGEAFDLTPIREKSPELAAELESFLDDVEFLSSYLRSLHLSSDGPVEESQEWMERAAHEDVSTGSLVGKNFGRFRIQQQLGEGGMGSVFLAEDPNLDCYVALKIPRLDKQSQSDTIKRFRREGQALAQVVHPNVCPIREVSDVHGHPYISMAYIEGFPLKSLIHRQATIPIPQVLTIVAKLADALFEVHEQGVVHRDLKPANVMLKTDTEPIIVDFGLAFRETDIRITQIRTVIGTPAYMSREQIQGDVHKISPQWDIHSLGVIFYELLTKQLPYAGTTFDEIEKAVMEATPTAPSQIRPGIDPEIDRVCLTMVGADPDRRFESMADVFEAITNCQLALGLEQTLSRGALELGLDAGHRWKQLADFDRDDAREMELPTEDSPRPGTGHPFPMPKSPADCCDTGTVASKNTSRIESAVDAHGQVLHPMPHRKERWPRWIRQPLFAIAVLVFVAATVTAAVITVQWNRQLVKIVVHESARQHGYQVIIDEHIVIKGEGQQLRLKPGDHFWTVKSNGLELKTRQFDVVKGETKLVAVTIDDVPSPGQDEDKTEPRALTFTEDNTFRKVTLLPRLAQVPSGLVFDTSSTGILIAEPNKIRRFDLIEKEWDNIIEIDDAEAVVEKMAGSGDGRYLALVSDHGVSIYDVSRSTEPVKLGSYASESQRTPLVAFNASGTLMALSRSDDTVELIKLPEQQTVKTLPVDAGPIAELELNSTGQRLVVAARKGPVLMWDLTGDAQPRRLGNDEDRPSKVAVSADGAALAVAYHNGHVTQWTVATGEIDWTIPAHAEAISCLSYAHSDRTLISGGYDKALRVWSREGGRKITDIIQVRQIEWVSQSPNGQFLGIALHDGTVPVVAVPANVALADDQVGVVATFLHDEKEVTALAVSPDGKYIVSATRTIAETTPENRERSTVYVWNSEDRSLLHRIRSPLEYVRRLKFLGDGVHFAALGADSEFQFWNADTGQPTYDLGDAGFRLFGTAKIRDFSWLPGTRTMVVVGNGIAMAIDLHELRTLTEAPGIAEQRLSSVAGISETVFLTGDMEGTVTEWSAPSGKIEAGFEIRRSWPTGHERIDLLQADQSGETLLVAGGGRKTVWDIANTPPDKFNLWINATPRAAYTPGVAALSGDGQRVLLTTTVDQQPRVDLFNRISDEPIVRFSGHSQPVTSLEFVSNTNHAVTAANDGTVQVLRLPVAADLDRAISEWVIEMGGAVAVRTTRDREFGDITDRESLPGTAFDCIRIVLNNNATIKPADLAKLRGLPHLVELQMLNTPAIANGLARLKDLPSLKVIQVSGAKLTPEDFKAIAKLRSLAWLNTHDAGINDEGVTELLPLHNLKSLSLSGSPLSDDAMAYCAGFSDLEYLNVDSSEITDAGLLKLANCPSLQKLFCRDTHVTEEGVKSLEGKRPHLKVIWQRLP